MTSFFMNPLSLFVFVLYTSCSLLLLLYGMNTYLLLFLYLRKRNAHLESDAATEAQFVQHFADREDLPVVTTQIPLYNEINVAERVIRAVAAIDYPSACHEIQILDDSDDETCALVDQAAADLRAQGHWIEVFRREDRIGYKAGALEAGMAVCKGEFIAIFDSDFIPPADFLRRTLAHLWADKNCGMVQARWDHINQDHSWLTRVQAMGIDGHFVIEQTARNRNGLFMNFCGTAGVWRREAIDDSGGWQHDTVTEDLDLSYRAQMRGWRFHYLPTLRVPAELPPTYSAFKSQQYRWAKGTLQTARKLLPTVWREPMPLFKKLQATVHLTRYGLNLQMALIALLVLPLIATLGESGVWFYRSVLFLSLLVPAAIGPSLGYVVCQYQEHPDVWKQRLAVLPFLLIVGFGICLSNGKAVLAGMFSNDSTFVRTPKAGETSLKSYLVKRDWMPRIEMFFAVYCAFTIAVLCYLGQYALIPFVAVYTLGFGVVGSKGLSEARI
ncbi:MAG: glycosyl transferase family 2 [Puniceicoccaceae bacterium]|nr:glycosyl transferase family 2 [Puniceicoccaceae bacterium]|tara:strand:+ start:4144 stop:5637 length:1494 start_codon:yes stop_codon:yes gene_type:complete